MFASKNFSLTAPSNNPLGAYTIARSARFNSSLSSYLNRTPVSASNRTTWTWSGWVKRGSLSVAQSLFSAGEGGNRTYLFFDANNCLEIHGNGNIWRVSTNVYRDPSAWYHIVWVMDTNNATAQNRTRIYINNVEITSWSTNNTISSGTTFDVNSTVLHTISKNSESGGTSYLDGYIAENNFIDGQALTPSSFGAYNQYGIWQPIKYTGTYGTNGFYLKFNSYASSAALGTDSSGNNNTWTVNNMVSTNSTIIWSNYLLAGASIAPNAASVFNGLGTGDAGNIDGVTTIFTPPSAISYSTLEIKWGNSNNNNSAGAPLYINGVLVAQVNGGQGGGKTQIYTTSTPGTFTSISVGGGISGQYQAHLDYIKVDGVYLTDANVTTLSPVTDTPTLTSATAGNYCTLNPLYTNGFSILTISNGNLTASSASGARLALGTFYLTTGKYYFEATCTTVASAGSRVGIRNDTVQRFYDNSGNYYDGTSSTSYGATYTSGDVISVAFDLTTQTITFYKNGLSQGQKTSIGLSGQYVAPFVYADTSGVWNVNFGQRPFTYTSPSGYVALNSYNLSQPTIPNGAQYMAATTYTGNGSTQSIINTVNSTSFQPDLVWVKKRSAAAAHGLIDSVRGAGIALASNLTEAERNNGTGSGGDVIAFNSNGFNLGNNTTGSATDSNLSGATYIGWQWRANAGTNVTNTDGSITSTVSANTSSGFSIVTYTGTGANATVGHGLSVAPSMIIVKKRSSATSSNWMVWHTSIGTGYVLNLNNTSASGATYWNNTAPTTTVFSLDNNANYNSNTDTFVSYCFAAIAGYSAFGSYVGNGSTDGPFIYTGFRPRFIMAKCSSNTTASTVWTIWDTSRSPYNASVNELYPNSNIAEFVDTDGIDILSNGFKPKRNSEYANFSGWTYIYMAFAENPFKYALAR